ncbi:MAG TPA: ABC transporter substrate-binding protein, partial [Chloroflexota bacterium]
MGRGGVLGILAVVLVACSPAASSGTGSKTDAGAPGPPKVLVWAGLREPAAFDSVIGLGGSGSPAAEVTPVVHDFLVVLNHRSEPVAQLAAARPSVSDGTWRVNTDGSMDTIWRLRPNIKWHDGTLLTSDDLLFALNLSIDPQLPKSQFGGLPYMASAEAPDQLTMIIHWSATYSHADREVGLGPLPSRLLAEHYRSPKDDFLNDPYFSTAFVGLGPYRLVHWEPGAQMEFTRFDDYYLGRPRLDGVIVRFIGDPVTMLANAEAGSVDIATPALSANLDAIAELRDRWGGTANRVVFDPSDSLRHLQLQFRPEFARPIGGLTNQAVRQALYTAIDRQALTDLMTRGA